MPLVFIVGIIIFAGFVFGELTTKLKLPKVTGYILAGIVIGLNVFDPVFEGFLDNTGVITNISLSFITFSVGGTLLYSKVKSLGKGILGIAAFESLFAFLFITLGMIAVVPYFISINDPGWLSTIIPVSIMLGSLGAPTDPSAILAVKHEFNAQGVVSSTIMGVAAFDDAAGIMIYSLGVAVAASMVGGTVQGASFLLEPLSAVVGALVTGILYGILFNLITRIVKKETEGVYIVLILGLILLCFGTSAGLGFDELLSTLAMGVVVVNFNSQRDMIFKMLERYIEELVFVLFFVISSMQLNFTVLFSSLGLVAGFVIFRALGKFAGTALGASISKSPAEVKKYTVGGLIPQGGIVIGLALMLGERNGMEAFSSIIINVIIGATVIHEIAGPVIAKMSLKKAGEIRE